MFCGCCDRIAVSLSDSPLAAWLEPLQMLRETLKWRAEYHPERLCWENIKHEGARGKLFILEHPDNDGRPVVLMRPRWVPPLAWIQRRRSAPASLIPPV